eukprot:15475129-Alexandrium_andersonii.AAC.1
MSNRDGRRRKLRMDRLDHVLHIRLGDVTNHGVRIVQSAKPPRSRTGQPAYPPSVRGSAVEPSKVATEVI